METQQPARRVVLTSIFNCRDLGGYPCADGRTTRFGRFLRCGIPFGPMPGDMQRLETYPVRTVIDLRGDTETKGAPSAFSGSAQAAYHHIPLLNVNPADPSGSMGTAVLWEVYRDTMDLRRADFARIFQVIASAQAGTVLFHCSLGKDRTGMLAALLLAVAGVELPDLMADYQLSATYLAPLYAMFENEAPSGGQGDLLLSDPQNIEKLFKHLDEKYGGVVPYLTGAGVTPEELGAVRARLV